MNNRRISVVLYSLCCLMLSHVAHADLIHITSGNFYYTGTNDVADLEASGDLIGHGTSSVDFGVGICDPAFPNPFLPPGQDPDEFGLGCPANNISFEGRTNAGPTPTGTFNMGTITFFNGDVGSIVEFVTSLRFEVSSVTCDTDTGCDESTTKSGDTLLNFELTVNSLTDIVGSSDSFCMVTDLGAGPEICAWVPEFDTHSFDLIGQFGSLNVVDIVPTSGGGFVTQGRDPNQNIIHARVNEPGSALLLALSALLAIRSRRYKKGQI